MVWIPLVLLSIEKLKTEGQKIWFVIGAFAIAFSLLAGHPQIPTYGLIVAGLYALTLALFGLNHPIRFLAICAGMFMAGMSLTAIQLVPLFELVSESIREKPDLSLIPINFLETFKSDDIYFSGSFRYAGYKFLLSVLRSDKLY